MITKTLPCGFLPVAQQEQLEEERRKAETKVKKEVVKVVKEPVKKKKVVVVVVSHSLSELHALRLRLESAEGSLSQYVHICLGEDGFHDCGLKITQLEVNTHI